MYILGIFCMGGEGEGTRHESSLSLFLTLELLYWTVNDISSITTDKTQLHNAAVLVGLPTGGDDSPVGTEIQKDMTLQALYI